MGLVCSNNEYEVINTTSDIFSGNLSYEWFINDVVKSTDRNLLYSFLDEGDFDIKLRTSLPGCSVDMVKQVTSVLSGPIVNFAYQGNCEIDNVVFTNESVGDISTYSWTFNDGQTSTAENLTHLFADPGNYNVTLQANSPNGCQNTKTKLVTIYSKPQPNFSLALPPFSCSGSSSMFTDTTPNPSDSNLSSWQWNFGDAMNSSSSQRNPQFIYSTAGNYDVSLTTTTNFGCSGTFQKTVTIAETPLVTIENTPSCIGQTVTFKGETSSIINNWNWQIGNTFYSIPEPTYLFNAQGNYNVTLSAVGSNGCLTSAQKLVYVPTALVPDFTWDINCAAHQTTFLNNTNEQDDPLASFDWNYAGLGTGTGPESTFSFPDLGIYDV
jgi:PKD repeat protein